MFKVIEKFQKKIEVIFRQQFEKNLNQTNLEKILKLKTF